MPGEFPTIKSDVRAFFELRIVLGDGTTLTAVLSETALKFSRVGES